MPYICPGEQQLSMHKLPDGLLIMIFGASLQQKSVQPLEVALLITMFGVDEQQESVHDPLERKADVTGAELMLQQLSMHCIEDMPGKAALTFMVGR